MSLPFRIVTLLALSIAARSAPAQNLVTNGSFETGDFTGYSLSSPDNLTMVESTFASDGGDAVEMGDLQGDGGCVLSQAIATTPGKAYTFSFDFAGDGDAPSGFSAAFGTKVLFAVTNPPFDNDYVTHTFAVTATAPITTLTFTGYDDANYLYLDNIVVTPQAAPEPATLAALGLGSFALLGRRKRA